MFTQQKYHRLMQGIMLKRNYKCMKRLKNFNLKFDRIKKWSIHIKTKCITGVIGDSRWPKYHWISPKDHQVTHTPQIFVCCIPNAVSQTKRPVDSKGMKQHNNNIEWNKWNHISLEQSSVITKYVPLFAAKMQIMMIMIK